MRISDWSADVCSSDLWRPPSTAPTYTPRGAAWAVARPVACQPYQPRIFLLYPVDAGRVSLPAAICNCLGSEWERICPRSRRSGRERGGRVPTVRGDAGQDAGGNQREGRQLGRRRETPLPTEAIEQREERFEQDHLSDHRQGKQEIGSESCRERGGQTGSI